MKILHAINYHRKGGGSDHAADASVRVSRARGLDVRVFSRDSKLLAPSIRGKLSALVNGVYAHGAVRAFEAELASFRPDIVHVHELFPLISPWIIPVCNQAGVPVVMTCYDFRLTCPVATHYSHGSICERCAGGNEQWALIRNCRGSYAESAAFALRSAVARCAGLWSGVSRFIVLTEFSREWAVRSLGVDASRVDVNACAIRLADQEPVDPARGSYVGFAGRFVAEKGVEVLVEAARLARVPLVLAGDAPEHPAVREGDDARCILTRGRAELDAFYRGCRVLVAPSLWYETFGIVAGEAMSHGVPVIASRIGALRDVVAHGQRGLTVPPGDPAALAGAIRALWEDPALCRSLGAAARAWVRSECTDEAHAERLVSTYRRALGRERAGS
jgi:glycosyltransferase involved in cell wall biosynthesis